MERLTMWYDGNHAICTNEDCESDNCPFADAPCEHVQDVIDRLAAYEDTGLEPEEILDGKELTEIACAMNLLKRYQALGPVEELTALVKARDEGLVHSMSCIGCRYDQTSSLREHEANCMRCIRNRYPDDHYTRAEAEAAIGGGGDGCTDAH